MNWYNNYLSIIIAQTLTDEKIRELLNIREDEEDSELTRILESKMPDGFHLREEPGENWSVVDDMGRAIAYNEPNKIKAFRGAMARWKLMNINLVAKAKEILFKI